MKARIVYDCNGTDQMVVTAGRISSQIWDGGRTQVRLRDRGRLTRVLQFERAHLIDTVYGGRLRFVAAFAGVVCGVAAGWRWARASPRPVPPRHSGDG